MKIFVTLLVLLFSVQTNAERTLLIGTLNYNPPFETKADMKAHYYGFDISLMNDICARLKYNCVYKNYTFLKLFKAVSSNKVNLGIASIIITRERQKQFLFTLPYMVSSGSFMVLSKSDIKSTKQLVNKKLGTIEGAVYKNVIFEHLGVNVNVKTYISTADLVNDLSLGNVDAALIDHLTAEYWTATYNRFKLIGKPLSVGNGYGIMASQQNADLIEQINRVILDMEGDGSYLKLYQQYFDTGN